MRAWHGAAARRRFALVVTTVHVEVVKLSV
jgi:hypothetical protein